MLGFWEGGAECQWSGADETPESGPLRTRRQFSSWAGRGVGAVEYHRAPRMTTEPPGTEHSIRRRVGYRGLEIADAWPPRKRAHRGSVAGLRTQRGDRCH